MKKAMIVLLAAVALNAEAQTTSPNLYSYSPDGKKWGVTNDSLRVVIAPLYDNEIFFFSNQYSFVTLNQKKGVVSATGKLVVPCVYDRLEMGDNGYEELLAVQNNKYGLVSAKLGKAIVPVMYDAVETRRMGLEVAAAKKGKFWGLVNRKTGKPVGKFEFDRIEGGSGIPFTAIVQKQLKSGVINTKTGAMILPAVYDEVSYDYDNGYQRYFILAYANGEIKKFDGSGKLVKEEKKEEAEEATEISVINQEGVKMDMMPPPPPPPPSEAGGGYSYNTQLYFYRTGPASWKVTAENRSGNRTEVLETFDLAGYDTVMKAIPYGSINYPAGETFLKAVRNGLTGLIQLNGKLRIEAAYEDILYSDYNDMIKTRTGKLFGLIDRKSFREIRKPFAIKIGDYPLNNTMYRVELPAGQIGYMNSQTGKIYIPGIAQ